MSSSSYQPKCASGLPSYYIRESNNYHKNYIFLCKQSSCECYDEAFYNSKKYKISDIIQIFENNKTSKSNSKDILMFYYDSLIKTLQSERMILKQIIQKQNQQSSTMKKQVIDYLQGNKNHQANIFEQIKSKIKLKYYSNQIIDEIIDEIVDKNQNNFTQLCMWLRSFWKNKSDYQLQKYYESRNRIGATNYIKNINQNKVGYANDIGNIVLRKDSFGYYSQIDIQKVLVMDYSGQNLDLHGVIALSSYFPNLKILSLKLNNYITKKKKYIISDQQDQSNHFNSQIQYQNNQSFKIKPIILPNLISLKVLYQNWNFFYISHSPAQQDQILQCFFKTFSTVLQKIKHFQIKSTNIAQKLFELISTHLISVQQLTIQESIRNFIIQECHLNQINKLKYLKYLKLIKIQIDQNLNQQNKFQILRLLQGFQIANHTSKQQNINIQQFMSNINNLRLLHIKQFPISSIKKYLTSIDVTNPLIQNFNLSSDDNQIDIQDIYQILQSVLKLNNLTQLSLKLYDYLNQVLDLISKSSVKIKALELYNPCYSFKNMFLDKSIYNFQQKMIDLEELNFSGTQISNKGMMIIAKHSPNLRYLTLYLCSKQYPILTYLSKLKLLKSLVLVISQQISLNGVLRNCRQLEILKVRFYRFEDKKLIRKQKRIERLFIAKSQINRSQFQYSRSSIYMLKQLAWYKKQFYCSFSQIQGLKQPYRIYQQEQEQ